MADYEYKVVAAPRKARPAKGAKRHEDQFALGLAELMNKMAEDDWEYLRAESLPCEERTGLTSRVVSYQSVLIFRRRIRANQKFFEVPTEKRLEHHEISEDQTERDVVFASRQAGATPAPAYMPDQRAAAGSSGSILSVLRARKSRNEYDAGNEDRLAAE